MDKSETIGAMATALSKVQAEIQDATKDTQAYNYKYANLGQILNIIRPLFSKNGLSVTQLPTQFQDDKGLNFAGVETVLMHESGEWMSSTMAMPVEQNKGMSLAQCFGVVISYIRRYSLAALAGITQEDNDAALNREEKKNTDLHSEQSAATAAAFMSQLANAGDFEALKDIYGRAYTWAKENNETKQGAAITKVYNDLKTLSGWT